MKLPSFSDIRVRVGIVVVLVILVGGVIRWRMTSTASTQPTYTTAAVQKGTLVAAITSSGQVSDNNSRAVTTAVTGVVKKVAVKNDEFVKAGQALAEITLDEEAKQTYTQALASYQSAKNAVAAAQAAQYSLQASMFGKWDSFKTLAESDTYKDSNSDVRNVAEFTVSEREWLAAEAQYKNQQLVLAQAQTALNAAAQNLKLNSPTLTAPIDGVVTGFSLQPGQVISTGSSSDTSTSSSSQTVAHIVSDALPTITVNLTEIDVTKVNTGDKATITLDALPDKTYTGYVLSIDTAGSVSSGVTSYPAVILFDTDVEQVLPNMSAQASIMTDSKTDTLIISSSAISTKNGVSTVQVMKNGVPTTVTVETGIASSTQTEILSGLSEGDEVVTSTKTTNTTNKTSSTTSPFSSLAGPGGMTGARGVR